ncbi:MAG: helix-turn-helix domain-containing protein [Synechococcus sp. SB0662_bin_45]|nr:helix-turn-helix domain-containing protein [Synechococcus sp. SB0668_bin_13]MYE21918.1 helix-turn-helix domain-containing protein [Synechococcus sp. SB0662_bin_45]
MQGRPYSMSVARPRPLGHGMVQRARIVLSWAEGEFHTVIAQRLGISHVTVGKWRRRFTARAMRRRKSRHWMTQAMLPLGPGTVEGVSHDTVRNGTTSCLLPP